MWFGFGIEHITRSLAKSREGLGCVAICAALGETHSPELSALVLSKFADLSTIPPALSPTIAQWKQLVKACSGCLATSRFGHLVRELANVQERDGASWKEASDPEDIAKALKALAKISTGHLDSVTLSGGPECAWLGAVAEWLLGLSITCEVDDKSVPVYHGCYVREHATVHVKIIYTSRASGDSSSDSSRALTMSKSYRLNEVSEIIRAQLYNVGISLLIRVPWHIALETTFGQRTTTQLFINLETVLSRAIGSAACLFECIAEAQNCIDEELLRRNICYWSGSYGREFLRSVSQCFPEIPEGILTRAIDCVGSSFHDSLMDYENAIARISSACGCRRHTLNEDGSPTVSETDKPPYHDHICMVSFTEMILHISRAKSAILPVPDLYPTQAGLFGVYRILHGRPGLSPKDRLLQLPYPSFLFFAATLYTGEAPMDKGKFVSARVHRGLCYYLDGLVSLPGPDSPEALSRVHVVPGTIQLGSRMYWEIRDPLLEAPRYPAMIQHACTSISAALELAQSFHFKDGKGLEAIATETENYLTFAYNIYTTAGMSRVSPAILGLVAAYLRGRISCQSRTAGPSCATPPKSVPSFTLVQGEGRVDTDELGICIRVVPRTTCAWCVALMAAMGWFLTGVMQYDDTSYFKGKFLATGECLGCCMRTAAQYGGGNVVYVV